MADGEMGALPMLLQDMLSEAQKAGADAADALAARSTSLSLSQRMGKPEDLQRSESQDIGLRVFVGQRVAIVSTNDLRPATLSLLARQAVAMAQAVPEDPFAGIADPSQLFSGPYPAPEIDPVEPDAALLTARAAAAEDTARAMAGITNSEGASASWGRSDMVLAATNGFVGSHSVTRHSLSVSVVAGSGTGMERDYDYDTASFGAELRSGEEIGRRAAERALRRLNPRKVASARLPILYDRRVSPSLLGHLAGAINGAAIARGTSFLKEALGTAVFAPGIRIVDDPTLPRGLRSRPFDGEGLPGARRAFIEDGVLTSWILDLRSGRQLGLASTGHASRGTGGPPSPSVTNFWLEAGETSVADMLREVGTGLLVTEMLGSSVNGITGDYSRGASGFWIENGELAYPVSEVTIAGNLKDMYRSLTPASDLERRYGMDAPTVRIDGMTIAGR